MHAAWVTSPMPTGAKLNEPTTVSSVLTFLPPSLVTSYDSYDARPGCRLALRPALIESSTTIPDSINGA